jgi:hypothetical protein
MIKEREGCVAIISFATGRFLVSDPKLIDKYSASIVDGTRPLDNVVFVIARRPEADEAI